MFLELKYNWSTNPHHLFFFGAHYYIAAYLKIPAIIHGSDAKVIFKRGQKPSHLAQNLCLPRQQIGAKEGLSNDAFLNISFKET